MDFFIEIIGMVLIIRKIIYNFAPQILKTI